jgi:predicted nucleic acid-binding protein
MEISRMAELMDTYRDLPMDFADASIISAAEQIGTRKIFCLDRDFYVYRLANGAAVEVIR